ncbi:amino acid permease-domain-containing protein [Thelonectria olida]|uniref:Amino acid permease-domain-containing protein n=1 Tax=Thelonectria olida TaxID=1576542 RepID=A0A9P8WC57_9HYPO|nr:amino acid permease-domain-containing protein [Thelonectria olida]
MSFWRRPFSDRKGRDDAEAEERGPRSIDNGDELSDGSVHYVVGKAGNDSETSYQDTVGAPVEIQSPLGYTVGPVTIVFLNISKMIGTGIFSTPSNILKGTGSIGLSLIYWALGFVTSITAFSVYLEFASYFPNRSGSEVVYLEQAFPKPKWLFPTAFAFQSVVLSFSSGNAIVFAQYLFSIGHHDPTNWELKGVAIAGYSLAVLLVALHTRYAYWFSNAIGAVKVATLLFIIFTGFAVLGGHTSVEKPKQNFHNSFEGKATAYGLTNALYKIIFSYAGYENAFNVVNEVKNPIKQIRFNGLIALFTVTFLYILTVVAYYAAVPKVEIMGASQTTAALFFNAVFGSSKVSRGLNFLISLSALGNLIAVLLGTSRVIRECGRQGVLPFPRFWASTRPFGTALGPYVFKWAITTIMIIAPPAGDAFNFITDLKVYPAAFFDFLMALGLILIRRRRKHMGLPPPTFRTWDWVLAFNILKNIYLLVMPWYPPDGGPFSGDVSFWYATYAATGLGILLACGGYHWLWTVGVPKLRGYRLRQEILEFEDGAQSQTLVKVPVAELEAWDASHDHSGRRLDSHVQETSHESHGGKEEETDSNKGQAK